MKPSLMLKKVGSWTMNCAITPSSSKKEEYQARALLAKSKRFFKKGNQRFSSTKATDLTECHKCGKKGHFAGDCWSKTSVSSYQSPFQPKLLHSSEHKPEPRQTKYFEAKYNKFKSKLALLNSSASDPSSSSSKNKGLIAKMFDWDEKEVSSDENEVTEVKALMALASKERNFVSKHPFPPLEKLTHVELVSGQKTIKLILKSKSTFKAETLKDITINEPFSAPARGNKSSLVSKTNLANAGKFIALRRGIKPRNPQHITKNYETCGSNVHTTFDHNDIEWFRKREALQAKKVESFKASKTKSSSALRSKTPTKRANKQQFVAMFSTKAEDIAAAGCYAIILWIKSQLTDYDIIYEKLPITIQFCTKKDPY
ncbi:retrovirus-related pol polyprotein from transposon TNT 1-94 [Tanacetum coccineum]